MGTIGARHARQIIENARRVLAIEAICSMQAVELRGVDKMSSVTKHYYDEWRKIVPSIIEDRSFSKDIERLSVHLEEGVG